MVLSKSWNLIMMHPLTLSKIDCWIHLTEISLLFPGCYGCRDCLDDRKQIDKIIRDNLCNGKCVCGKLQDLKGCNLCAECRLVIYEHMFHMNKICAGEP